MGLLFKKRKALLLAFIILILIFYFMIYQCLPASTSEDETGSKRSMENKIFAKIQGPLTKENLAQRVTIIIREFEDFDNNLVKTVESIKDSLGNVKILIIADDLPYPPVKLTDSVAELVTLATDLQKNFSSACPFDLIETEYVLFIPDSTTIQNWTFFKNAISFLKSKRDTRAVAVTAGTGRLECSGLEVDFKRWTITFPANWSSLAHRDCPQVREKHALLLQTKTLKSLPEPFARPFPFTFYVQARLKRWIVRISKSARVDVLSPLYTDPHSSWKHKRAETERLHAFYKKVGIKREILPNGVSQYYGCTKDTPRCFGTVVNDMPDYLYQGRWTPPCCLKALRLSVSYVFKVLEKCGVRYWLEGGSLLGAARHGDIIPWDYDVDIGIYREDVEKCPPLLTAKDEKFVDDEDFVWEKAGEGDFFRVQYSEVNHLHVDIYPFYSKNGTMTKDTWFPTHRQDTEFPEAFLKPLTKIEFAGTKAGAPNNVKKFLEFKFGVGVVENPKYPNYQKPRCF